MATTFTQFKFADGNITLNNGAETFMFQFANPVIGLELSDFTVKGVTLSDLQTSDGGKSWTMTVTLTQLMYAE